MATLLFRDGSPPSPKERGKFDKLLFDTLFMGLGGGAFVPGGFGGGTFGRSRKKGKKNDQLTEIELRKEQSHYLDRWTVDWCVLVTSLWLEPCRICLRSMEIPAHLHPLSAETWISCERKSCSTTKLTKQVKAKRGHKRHIPRRSHTLMPSYRWSCSIAHEWDHARWFWR